RPELDPPHHRRSRAFLSAGERVFDGALHALVNNAGGSPKAPTKERLRVFNGDLAKWRRGFQLKFFVPLTLAFAPALAQGKGRSSISPRSPAIMCIRLRAPPFDIEGGAIGIDARDGGRLRAARRPRQRRRPRRVETAMLSPETTMLLPR